MCIKFRFIFTLFSLLISRFIAMYFIPLNHTAEARYGEIARKMLEQKTWITPLHDYGIPWAKPPLSMWLTAFSMKLFGINEWAARLPSLLLSIGILGFIWCWAKKQSSSLTALIALLVLADSLGFLANAGTVMTDSSLLFSLTLCLIAYWFAIIENNKTWGYLFFLGLG